MGEIPSNGPKDEDQEKVPRVTIPEVEKEMVANVLRFLEAAAGISKEDTIPAQRVESFPPLEKIIGDNEEEGLAEISRRISEKTEGAVEPKT